MECFAFLFRGAESLHEQPNVRTSSIKSEPLKNALEISFEMNPKNEAEREPLPAEFTELTDVIDLKTPVSEEVDDNEPPFKLHCSRKSSTALSTPSTRGTCGSLMHGRSFYASANSVLTDAADDIPEPSNGSADCLKLRPDRKPKEDDNIQKPRKLTEFEIPVRNGMNGREVGICSFSNKNNNQTVLTLKHQIEHKLKKQKLEAPVKRQQLFHGTEILENHVDLFNLRGKEVCMVLMPESPPHDLQEPQEIDSVFERAPAASALERPSDAVQPVEEPTVEAPDSEREDMLTSAGQRAAPEEERKRPCPAHADQRRQTAQAPLPRTWDVQPAVDEACGLTWDDEQAWRLTFRPEQRHESLSRFQAELFGAQQVISRTLANLQRESPSPRDAVKKHAPLDTDEFTMVFTDVQGSTRLCEDNQMAMGEALRLHDEVVRFNIAKHNGYEVTTEGDAFHIAFHNAEDAIGFCLDVQTDLESCDWPEATLQHPDACVSNDGAWRGLRVRMGVHSGKPFPPTKHEVTGRWCYAGRSVAVTKAIEEASHGGQILVSEDSFAQISGLLTQLQCPQVIDLGEHILQVHGLADAAQQKDEQVRLFQLVPAAFAHDYYSDDPAAACSQSQSHQPAAGAPEPAAGASSRCTGGRVFPPVKTKAEVSPGFHASPAGEKITMCFVYTMGAKDLVASNPALARLALGMLRQCVRSLLTAFGRRGYECQEAEGDFMLAFPNLREAAAFATNLQSELARLPWQDELRSCSPSFEQGLKVSIGALHGRYASRGPHRCTGRADYNGKIVNRTARIAQSAHPAQVLFGCLCGCELSSGLVSVELPAGASLERLGAFKFKGVSDPLHVYELRSPSDDGQFETFPEPKTGGRVGDECLELASGGARLARFAFGALSD